VGCAVALLLGFAFGSAAAVAFGSGLGIAAADELGVLTLPSRMVAPQRVAEVGELRHLPSIWKEPVEFRRAPSVGESARGRIPDAVVAEADPRVREALDGAS
jgi:hypothetical protein